ncbi:MAG TPA: helix-turn-helix domain-containing protein [Cyanophyceae cyanobacterium]
MFDSLSVPVPSLSSLLILGGLFLMLVYLDSRSKITQAPLKYDSLLLSRMKQLGMNHFVNLQQKSGLTDSRLRRVRSGELMSLTLQQLTQIATALDWTVEELLLNFDIEAKSLSKRSQELEALRNDCLRLREESQNQKLELTKELYHLNFEQLQNLLTNYPTVRQLAQAKPDLPAKNLISLFTPLDNLIKSWGYELIGQPWEQVPFNPQFHQPDVSDIEIGELVYIRFVGYRDGELILCPAKVSRTLPGGIKNSKED